MCSDTRQLACCSSGVVCTMSACTRVFVYQTTISIAIAFLLRRCSTSRAQRAAFSKDHCPALGPPKPSPARRPEALHTPDTTLQSTTLRSTPHSRVRSPSTIGQEPRDYNFFFCGARSLLSCANATHASELVLLRYCSFILCAQCLHSPANTPTRR